MSTQPFRNTQKLVLVAALAGLPLRPTPANAQLPSADQGEFQQSNGSTELGGGTEEMETQEGDSIAEDLPAPAQVEHALLQALREKRYKFCNDTSYVLLKAERRLCVHAESAAERCPAMVEICARPPSLDREGSLFGQGWAGRSSTEEAADPDKPPWELKLPESVAAIFRGLFFVMIGLGAALLTVYIVRNFRRFRSKTADDLRASEIPELETANAARRAREVESDVQKLLARAKTFAANGDYSAATNDVFAALLRHLDHTERLKLHPSKTNGDYVRDLRPHPQWRDAVRESARDIERYQFGKSPPDHDGFWRLLAMIEPLVSKPLAILVYLGFLGCLLAPLSGCDATESGRAGSDHWGALGDHSAAGFSALVTLLKQRGLDVDNHRGRISKMDPEVDAMFIYDRTLLKAADWETLKTWVAAGHHLIIAGDSTGAQHFNVETNDAPCGFALAPAGAYGGIRRKDAEPYSDPATVVGETAAATLALGQDSDFAPLINCGEQPIAVWRTLGSGQLTILSDADLVSNASLAAKDNALMLTGVFPLPPARVVVAGGIVGAGASSPMQSLTNAKLNLLLLQGALFLLVLYWANGARFGKLRDPEPAGRREFLDHIRALGRVFARAQAAGHALGLYSAWALDRLHARIRPGSRLSVIELSEAIAERTGRKPGEVMRILAEAASARDRDSHGEAVEDLKTLKELEQLVIETGGTR